MNRLPLALASLLLLLPLVPVGYATPATVTVSNTWYTQGGHFHVEGNVTDLNGVNHVSVIVPGGAATATLSGTMFTADVSGIVYAPGTYNITIVVYDSSLATTTVTTTITVTGFYTVFYDRVVYTSIGAYANLEEVVLPRLYGGSVVVDNLDLVSSVVVQQVNTGATIPTCLALGLLDAHYECGFTVRPINVPFEIVRVQGPEAAVRVTISGYAL